MVFIEIVTGSIALLRRGLSMEKGAMTNVQREVAATSGARLILAGTTALPSLYLERELLEEGRG